ncbi:protein maelstrom 1 [Tribolium madens]|uniref:protein maelstrom 1 n=1 Tax=Tribolium madens TaxID=41895 RepID=UPI001CF71D71|nr:protein maelstrom 1 [Tribolium madens]
MPPKKNKKPSRNGFWEFVLDCRNKHPNKTNMQEIQEYAARKWTSMSAEEKHPYEERASRARDMHSSARYTTDGVDIEVVERKEQEKANKKQEMKDDITRTLKAANFAMNLDEKIFLIIHVNHLTYYPSEDKYFICELAVAAVSLKSGIEDVFHRIVKPGKLPLGFYGGALNHSKETHQLLEIVQDEPYENNTHEVFTELTYFLKKWTGKENQFIVYADEKTHEMTTRVIGNFCQEFNYSGEIKVYNSQFLFFALRNAVAGRTIWPTETYSITELEKDIYSYTPDISCDFHEMSDISVYCSKSIVTRYCYTLCDHCCADLNIQLVPGFHVPKNSRILTYPSRTNSKAPSVCSTDDYRQAARSRIGSFSSSYDGNFPALGSSKSSASSVVSFSSMRTPKNAGQPNKAATRIEQSFKAMSVGEAKRDYRKLNFPEHGYKKQEK